MIQHVFERAVETGINSDYDIVVATDDERIQKTCAAFGAHAVITSSSHASGTDRLAEVAATMGWDEDTIIVNLQGDEPLMPADLIVKVASNLSENPAAGIATLSTPITDACDLFDPNVVKVVTNKNKLALYFSRAAIPWDRALYSSDQNTISRPLPQRHLGLYAYRAVTLKEISTTPEASIETQESLEQLRALWLGIGIHVESITTQPGHGVDTAEDMERVRSCFTSGMKAKKSFNEGETQ